MHVAEHDDKQETAQANNNAVDTLVVNAAVRFVVVAALKRFFEWIARPQ